MKLQVLFLCPLFYFSDMQEGIESFYKQLKPVTKTFKKGAIIQVQGDPATYAYYVKSGMLRSYTIDDKGKEHVFMFAPEGWVITDVYAHYNQSNSDLFIDALEDTEVIAFNGGERNTFDRLHELTELEVSKLIKRIGVLQQRIIMLMSATALERYEHFLKTYPDISHRVPQRMIASYLGITPEALSKIRSQRFK